MKITISEKGTGKTTNLIKRCFEENQKPNNLTYIVCASRQDVEYVAKMAKKLNINIPFPMSFRELLRHSGRGYIRNILIDDFDLCLRQISPFNILEITARDRESETKHCDYHDVKPF